MLPRMATQSLTTWMMCWIYQPARPQVLWVISEKLRGGVYMGKWHPDVVDALSAGDLRYLLAQAKTADTHR